MKKWNRRVSNDLSHESVSRTNRRKGGTGRLLSLLVRLATLRLGRLLQQLAKSGQGFDLERVRVADDVLAETLARGEDFLRGRNVGDELVLRDGDGNRQLLPGAVKNLGDAILQNGGSKHRIGSH